MSSGQKYTKLFVRDRNLPDFTTAKAPAMWVKTNSGEMKPLTNLYYKNALNVQQKLFGIQEPAGVPVGDYRWWGLVSGDGSSIAFTQVDYSALVPTADANGVDTSADNTGFHTYTTGSSILITRGAFPNQNEVVFQGNVVWGPSSYTTDSSNDNAFWTANDQPYPTLTVSRGTEIIAENLQMRSTPGSVTAQWFKDDLVDSAASTQWLIDNFSVGDLIAFDLFLQPQSGLGGG